MRADRLLSLMLLLQTRGRQTALELSEQLEVSLRTVYRDLDALSSAGIPVYTQSGPNGGVFLDEHYRVSLNGLSREDVRALFLSSAAGPLKDIGLGKSDMLLKLFAALPSAHRAEVERLRQRLYIDPANWFQVVEPQPFLPPLQQAVWEDRLVQVRYQPVEGQVIERTLEAYGLVAKANIWYFIGRKCDSGEFRNFRIRRLSTVELCEARFVRDDDFDLSQYWTESCANYERESFTRFPRYQTVLRVHPDVFWVFPGFLEGRYEQIGEIDAEGWRTLRVSFDSLGDARARVLGMGTSVEVCEPDELLSEVVNMAQSIVEKHALKRKL